MWGGRVTLTFVEGLLSLRGNGVYTWYTYTRVTWSYTSSNHLQPTVYTYIYIDKVARRWYRVLHQELSIIRTASTSCFQASSRSRNRVRYYDTTSLIDGITSTLCTRIDIIFFPSFLSIDSSSDSIILIKVHKVTMLRYENSNRANAYCYYWGSDAEVTLMPATARLGCLSFLFLSFSSLSLRNIKLTEKLRRSYGGS